MEKGFFPLRFLAFLVFFPNMGPYILAFSSLGSVVFGPVYYSFLPLFCFFFRGFTGLSSVGFLGFGQFIEYFHFMIYLTLL